MRREGKGPGSSPRGGPGGVMDGGMKSWTLGGTSHLAQPGGGGGRTRLQKVQTLPRGEKGLPARCSGLFRGFWRNEARLHFL